MFAHRAAAPTRSLLLALLAAALACHLLLSASPAAAQGATTEAPAEASHQESPGESAPATEISPHDLALVYVETVRGNTDNTLEHIYAAAFRIASERLSEWMAAQRTAAAHSLGITWSRFSGWVLAHLPHRA